MRKFIIGIVALVAMLAIPSIASADVPRCAATVTSTTTATMQLFNPKGVVGQWGDVWIHDLNITVATDGSFIGSGTEHNIGGDISVGVTVVGQIEPGNMVSMTVTNGDDPRIKQILSHKLMDSTSKDTGTVTLSDVEPDVSWDVEARVTAPVFTFATTTDLNHGQYVSSQGGGSVAAKKCAGMPLNSKQGV